MSQLVHTPHQTPAWAEGAVKQIGGAAGVLRELSAALWQLVLVCACVGALGLIGWFVVGVFTGFIAPTALFAGGLGGLVEAARRAVGKDKE